jgi:predicted TIM-barrel fold metal-dependent hydrolase
VGGERLLCGTDHPVGQPFDLVAGMLERLQCTDEERDLIYCGNAKRLLRVK